MSNVEFKNFPGRTQASIIVHFIQEKEKMQLVQQSGISLLAMTGKILFQKPLNFKYVIQMINILLYLASICTRIISYSQKTITVDKFMKHRVAIS